MSWEQHSTELLKDMVRYASGCPTCHGRGLLSDGTCNCCAAGELARRLMTKCIYKADDAHICDSQNHEK